MARQPSDPRRPPEGPPSRLRRLTAGAGALALVLALWLPRSLWSGEGAPDSTQAEADTSADSLEAAPTVVLPPPGGGELLPASPHPFGPGERLKFSVQYGIISAGTAWLEVADLHEYQGRPVYTLVARAQSNGFIDRIYKVRNHIESFMDRDGRFSWRYFENRREGRYRKQQEVLFDPVRREAVYPDGARFPIPPRAQDALSSFYYTRYLPLPIGGSVIFDYHASRKSVPLEVKILGRERVEVPAGKFDCVVVEPLLKAGGVFKNKGRLWIWLTDDERRLPVQMKSKVTIGSVSVILTEIRSGA
jgi:hypothetical protein